MPTRFRTGAFSLFAAVLGLLPAAGVAQDNPLVHGALSLGAGVFFGYQAGWDPGRSGFEWGFEAYATHRFGDLSFCGDGTRSGFGPIMQVGIRGVENPRLTVAARGGFELTRSVLGVTGELGMSYRFGEDPGASIHIGVMPETWLFAVGVRHQLLREETWIGGSMRYLPTFGTFSCPIGPAF